MSVDNAISFFLIFIFKFLYYSSSIIAGNWFVGGSLFRLQVTMYIFVASFIVERGKLNMCFSVSLLDSKYCICIICNYKL